MLVLLIKYLVKKKLALNYIDLNKKTKAPYRGF
jgi:hypothetical protein